MKRLLLLFAAVLGFAALSSCGGNGNNCAFGAGFSVQIADELNALSDASIRYGNDPTTANCESYVAAYRDYIDALKSLRGCYAAYGSLDEYNESLEDAEQSLDDIDCQ